MSHRGTKEYCANGHSLKETRFEHSGVFRCRICWQEQCRKGRLKRYKLSIEDFNAMAKKQKNKCLICGNKPTKKDKDVLHVDHSHATGKVRGLLCAHCNQGLGHFRDNVDIILKAIKYLQNYSKPNGICNDLTVPVDKW